MQKNTEEIGERPTSTWGNWRYLASTNELQYKDGQYHVDLDEHTTAAGVLDDIFQLHGKAWMNDRDLRDFIRAVEDLIHPQANLCSFGGDRTTTTLPGHEAAKEAVTESFDYWLSHTRTMQITIECAVERVFDAWLEQNKTLIARAIAKRPQDGQ